tara:strand:- start:2223 stop:2822 length:600 start_codon:yes stop_codon:yes gene_type:complete
VAILKVEINVPLSVTLQGPIGEQIQGQYGMQYQYGMVEGILYADAKLHAALAPHPVGSQVTILKTQEQFTAQDGSLRKANNYAVTPNGGAPVAAPQAPQYTPQPSQVPQGASGDAYGDMVSLLQSCMQSVESIAPQSYGPAERQSAAVSLFIGCQQKGVKPQGVISQAAPPVQPAAEYAASQQVAPPLPQAPNNADLPF